MNEKYKYKISIIMCLYNVEKYFEDAINSIINQNIGFKENIQIILVNDGSPDNIEKLCKKYVRKYPNNIKYIYKTNGGIGDARNTGLKYIEGEIVNFFDPDDILEKNVCKKAYNFIKKYEKEIDLVACRINFFEGRTGFEHALDYKFDGDKIIDIIKDPHLIHLSVATAFIKHKALKNIEFDKRLKFSEDSIFVAKVILEKEKYGVLKSAVYNYRKRIEETSLINTKTEDSNWYTSTVKYNYLELYNYTIKKYKKIIPYIQYQIMYDLQWRLKTITPSKIDKKIEYQYKLNIIKLLQKIDAEVIMNQKNMTFIYKIYALKLKYGDNFLRKSKYNKDKNSLVYNEKKVLNFNASDRFLIKIIEVDKNMLHIEGSTDLVILDERYKIYIKYGDNKYKALNYKRNKLLDCLAFDREKIVEGKTFFVDVPIKSEEKISFIMKYNGKNILLYPKYLDMAKLSSNVKISYFISEKFIIKRLIKSIKIMKKSRYTIWKYESLILLELLKKIKFNLIFYRLIYYLIKSKLKKEIWIISDRTHIADDNGEHFFKYLMDIEANKKYNIYFLLSKKSKDYKRLKSYGIVLEPNSIKYKILFLLSSKIISAQADDWVINPFIDNRIYMKDLYNFKYVFLQHGIIKDNLSRWLNKHNKNIKIFITSSIREKQAIITGDYGYTNEEVKLTGIARFDKLINKEKKIIVFLPTWRKKIAGKIIPGSSKREYSHIFKQTEYFKFYNNLINDKRLLNEMKKNGYKGEFYVHPSLYMQSKDFEGNNTIKVGEKIADYQKIIKESALLITDYSSVAFDFAYMKKPIIYTQFDKNTFYADHLSTTGYFTEEKDGFGPVVYDYETSIKEIIKKIKCDCKNEKYYIKKVDKFYKYFDKNNCKRIYEEIKRI